jgi:hypothetical protein
LPRVGALAQLARAFDWQSRGHRFDSDMLHSNYQRVTIIQICSPFFFARILPESCSFFPNTGRNILKNEI